MKSGIEITEVGADMMTGANRYLLTVFQESVFDERRFIECLQSAFRTVIEKEAELLLRAHREELESVFSVEDLRKALSAELSKQFIAGMMAAAQTLQDEKKS